MTQTPLLTVNDLSVRFTDKKNMFDAVKHVSFSMAARETLAVVGESGSGKSVTALSLMQLLPYPLASHPSGSIRFEGQELINAPHDVMRKLRGRKMAMIFQEPLTSLNPLHTIEQQISEVINLHRALNRDSCRDECKKLLDMVGLPQMKDRLESYPHQLSGGQRQRVMIAMSIANNPQLLIADEPTTALDVTIQAQILELLQDLKSRLNMALLLITHDLKIVEKMADTVCVMQKGELVEHASTSTLFTNPQHNYTKMLLAAQPQKNPPACDTTAPIILEAENVKVHFASHKNWRGVPKKIVKAVDDISFTLKAGQTLGVVGESGSGKTTLGLAALKLLPAQGVIKIDGQNIANLNKESLRNLRAKAQIVFQDPFGSLSPRMSVAQIIREGLDVHEPHLSEQDRDLRVIAALESVRLDPATRYRYPHEFSGGQRQRIAIARALILKPKLIILDEPTSALDVSVQVQIVDLLAELQRTHNLAYLFISHDLRVVRALAHHVLVMKNGKAVEYGAACDVFDTPRTDYTRTLMDAALNLRTHLA
jgi:microcin C transport system ATP-binding protein